MKKRTHERPVFPKRCIVTAGMPYGNKNLHFGHIGGVFVHADVFARFMRDRIGDQNVIFVSGTDCYGSPISESYRKQVEDGGFTGDIRSFVESNHKNQKEALDAYKISLDFFGGSALGEGGQIHTQMSHDIFNCLLGKGYLEKLRTYQFFDSEQQVFLNGRQVVGKCPIEGCSSENAYADECSLGHQYSPEELLEPRSCLSGKKPDMKQVENWYFKLGDFNGLLKEWAAASKHNPAVRPFIIKNIEEYLEAPKIHIKKSQKQAFAYLQDSLPPHCLEEDEKRTSFTIVFSALPQREEACKILTAGGIRYRTGKTLVPFRLSGNAPWGIPVPGEEEGALTFWVWPESLWAPLSFTKAYLDEKGGPSDAWREWWCSKESKVFQFIGEDNIYFYGLAEMAMFMALNTGELSAGPPDGQVQLPILVANNHLLFMDKKAGSSGKTKPPMAMELLQWYTLEQLRSHFLGLGLGTRSVSFQPKALKPQAEPSENDPVMKEGNLLTNVYNRLVRSCFYTAQKYYQNRLPKTGPDEETLEKAAQAILEFESLMSTFSFHLIMNLLDSYIRDANKYWVREIRQADLANDPQLREKVLANSFHAVRTAAILLHPIAPEGTEMVREFLGVGEEFWNWQHVFEDLAFFIDDIDDHKLKSLPARVDFFKKLDSQL